MGLAVSQVRLLALTNRKADIELQMQVNSKRKQSLTRKATELSQEYYSRLQNSSIQYATSNGYEDVDYSYIMGETEGNHYTTAFIHQIASGDTSYTAQKPSNSMILTNQKGEVVVNDDIAVLVQKVKESYPDSTTKEKTAEALYQFLRDTVESSTISAPQSITALYNNVITRLPREDKLNADGTVTHGVVTYLKKMIENGGYQNGGLIYTDGTSYFSDINGKNKMTPPPQDCYCYRVQTVGTSGSSTTAAYKTVLFYDGKPVTTGGNNYITPDDAETLANITSYFGTIISAALSNGMSTDVTKTVLEDGSVVYKVDSEGNKNFVNAMNKQNLQAGFKSGSYQLAMVTDIKRGTYHKNTTLEYFTHMNYVVERTDSSMKEKITAWFNTEQAKISEKETYWDTEIQNLSTELNSVNTEIESVKQLKSNAIKSVFNWGGN